MSKSVNELIEANRSGTPWAILILDDEITQEQVAEIDNPVLWYVASIGIHFSDSFILANKDKLKLHEVITRHTLKPETVEQLWYGDLKPKLIVHQRLPKSLISAAVEHSPSLTIRHQKLGVDELLVNKDRLNFDLVVEYQTLTQRALEVLADELNWGLVYKLQELSPEQKQQFRPRLLASFLGNGDGLKSKLFYWYNLLTKGHLLR